MELGSSKLKLGQSKLKLGQTLVKQAPKGYLSLYYMGIPFYFYFISRWSISSLIVI